MKKKELSLRHLLVTEMPYKLLSFLIEERVLTSFVNNTLQNLSKSREVSQLYDRRVSDIMSDSFVWYNTYEGYFFWYKLYKKYRDVDS